MRRRRRIKSVIKWGGAAMTVLLLIVWVGSRWYVASIAVHPLMGVHAVAGLLCFTSELTLSQPIHFEASITRHTWDFEWWSDYSMPYRGRVRVGLPLWLIAALIGVPATLIWRQDLKRVPGTCRKCRYSRTGLSADRACPECGTVPEVKPPAAA